MTIVNFKPIEAVDDLKLSKSLRRDIFVLATLHTEDWAIKLQISLWSTMTKVKGKKYVFIKTNYTDSSHTVYIWDQMNT